MTTKPPKPLAVILWIVPSAGEDDPSVLPSLRKLAQLATHRTVLIGIPSSLLDRPSALAQKFRDSGMSTGEVRYAEIGKQLQRHLHQVKATSIVHDGVGPLSIAFVRAVSSSCRVVIARETALTQLMAEPPGVFSVRVFDEPS